MLAAAQRRQGATGHRRSEPVRFIFCLATALAVDTYGYVHSRTTTGVSAAGQALSHDVAPAFVFHKLPTPSRRCAALRGRQAVCARVAEHPQVASQRQTTPQLFRPLTDTLPVPRAETGHHGVRGGVVEAGGARAGDLTPTLRLRPSELAYKPAGDMIPECSSEKEESTGPPPPCQETRQLFRKLSETSSESDKEQIRAKMESVSHLSIKKASLQLGLSERSLELNRACALLALAPSFKEYARVTHGAYGCVELRDVSEETCRLFGTLSAASEEAHKAEAHFMIEGVAHLSRMEASIELGLPQRGAQLDRACVILGAESFRDFALTLHGGYGHRKIQTLPDAPLSPAPAEHSTSIDLAESQAGAAERAPEVEGREARVGGGKVGGMHTSARLLFGTLSEASGPAQKAAVRARLESVAHLDKWEALATLHLPWRGVQLERACTVLGFPSFDDYCASIHVGVVRTQRSHDGGAAAAAVERTRKLFAGLTRGASVEDKVAVRAKLEGVAHLGTAAASAQLGLPLDVEALNKVCRILGAASFEHLAIQEKHARDVRAIAKAARVWQRDRLEAAGA